ncbi:MAG: hypothetical protein LIO43_04935 [Clostridiales bacterium]|nr:hypothetical protein [Clostridiales bacterium]
MNYGIGLDCGIASVGFAVFELNEKDEPCRIIRLGSRVFDKAEGSDGGSLAAKRRGFRSARRLTRRHKHRLDRTRKLLIDYKIISRDELDELFSGKSDDIYMLRAKSLDEPVNNKEFARILINLAQHRGFKSNRKSDLSSNDDKKFLSILNENSELCKNYRTVGEMFYKDEKYAEHKRNKGKSHLCTVYRSMIEEEIKKDF